MLLLSIDNAIASEMFALLVYPPHGELLAQTISESELVFSRAVLLYVQFECDD